MDLSCNKIADIEVLGKVKFEKIEKLNLIGNLILDYKVLEKVKFKSEILYIDLK